MKYLLQSETVHTTLNYLLEKVMKTIAKAAAIAALLATSATAGNAISDAKVTTPSTFSFFAAETTEDTSTVLALIYL